MMYRSLSQVFAQVAASPNAKHLHTRQASEIDKSNDKKRAYDQEVAKPKTPSVWRVVSLEEATLIKLAKGGNEQAVNNLIALKKKQREQQEQQEYEQER